VLTVVAIALVTSFMLGAITRALRDRREFARFCPYRIAVAWLVTMAGFELLMLKFDYRAPLTDRHVWIPLALLVLHTAQNWSARYRTPGAGPEPGRYAYTPSRQDVRLVWLALSLPGAALLAVFAVLIAHAVTAHS
jgi:hypothetical protein